MTFQVGDIVKTKDGDTGRIKKIYNDFYVINIGTIQEPSLQHECKLYSASPHERYSFIFREVRNVMLFQVGDIVKTIMGDVGRVESITEIHFGEDDYFLYNLNFAGGFYVLEPTSQAEKHEFLLSQSKNAI